MTLAVNFKFPYRFPFNCLVIVIAGRNLTIEFLKMASAVMKSVCKSHRAFIIIIADGVLESSSVDNTSLLLTRLESNGIFKSSLVIFIFRTHVKTFCF